MAGAGVRERLGTRIQSGPHCYCLLGVYPVSVKASNESLWLIRKTLLQGKFNKGTECEGFISPEYRAIWKRLGGRRGCRCLSPGPFVYPVWLWGRKVGEVPMVTRSCACESPLLAATALGPECHCPLNLNTNGPSGGVSLFCFFNFQLLVFTAVRAFL